MRHEVVLPPRTDPVSVIFKKYSKRPVDKLFLKDHVQQMEKNTKGEKEGQKPPEVDKNKLNQDLIKQYMDSKYVNEKSSICKFYMKGLCMFTEEECKYCHSFDTLKYVPRDFRILDPEYFEQKALFAEPRLNYFALERYQEKLQQKDPSFTCFSLGEINKTSTIRQELRFQMHNDLYIQFMRKLEELYPHAHFTVSFVRREYNNAGLNKTKVDKFPSFLERLETIGFEVDSFLVPPCLTVKKEYVFRRPPMEELHRTFGDLLVEIVRRKLNVKE